MEHAWERDALTREQFQAYLVGDVGLEQSDVEVLLKELSHDEIDGTAGVIPRSALYDLVLVHQARPSQW